MCLHKLFISFQNYFDVISWLCQGKVYKTFPHLKSHSASNITLCCAQRDGLSGQWYERLQFLLLALKIPEVNNSLHSSRKMHLFSLKELPWYFSDM
jgi:hypothetical protein